LNRKTPVALFTYDRPQHTQLALESLAACDRLDECQLYIYCDQAKGDAHLAGVAAARKVVREWAPRLSAIVIERNENFGLARSIVGGITDLCDKYGRAIAIEDDFVLSPDFLDFMLRGLERYEQTSEVYQISGYMFPVVNPPEPQAFFMKLSTTWGWATWQRAWSTFDWRAMQSHELFSKPAVRRSFDLDGSYPYSSMLEQRLSGMNDSWGILWWWNVFRQRALVLYPRQSLVWVGGFDGSGTHCDDATDVNLDTIERFKQYRLPTSYDLPNQLIEAENPMKAVKEFLRQQQILSKRSMEMRLRRRLRKLFSMVNRAQ